MSRFSGVLCCAMVVLLVLVSPAPFAAQEQTVESTEPVELGVEARTAAALDLPLKSPLDFPELPLIEITNTLQDEYDIPIVFDLAALDEVAISPETEIAVNLRDISLRSALNLIFRQPGVEDLTYVVDNEVLLITTRDRADATVLVRMFRVDDLDLFGNASDSRAANTEAYSSLVAAIASCVEPDSWKAKGTGNGELILLKPGILIVVNSRRVLQQVEDFLDELRDLKSQIERGGNTPTQPAGSF